MISNTWQNVQKCFLLLYYTHINFQTEWVAQVVYPDHNHNDVDEALNKGNGTSPTVEKEITLILKKKLISACVK